MRAGAGLKMERRSANIPSKSFRKGKNLGNFAKERWERRTFEYSFRKSRGEKCGLFFYEKFAFL